MVICRDVVRMVIYQIFVHQQGLHGKMGVLIFSGEGINQEGVFRVIVQHLFEFPDPAHGVNVLLISGLEPGGKQISNKSILDTFAATVKPYRR